MVGVGVAVGVGVMVGVLEGRDAAVGEGVSGGAMNGVIVRIGVDVGPPNGARLDFKMPVLDASSNTTMPNRQTSPSPAMANIALRPLRDLVSGPAAAGACTGATPGG